MELADLLTFNNVNRGYGAGLAIAALVLVNIVALFGILLLGRRNDTNATASWPLPRQQLVNARYVIKAGQALGSDSWTITVE